MQLIIITWYSVTDMSLETNHDVTSNNSYILKNQDVLPSHATSLNSGADTAPLSKLTT